MRRDGLRRGVVSLSQAQAQAQADNMAALSAKLIIGIKISLLSA
jgi:hypothetical protein